ncbi:hypothetical protein AAVH_28744 [Aphelenchoides avenae]|nr:hypothetical protein AAVH_28744 [Aphelenchus avenae]
MILPAETFSDVVSFLEYYDLGGLKLANKMCSSVAQQCADATRLFDFSDLELYVFDSWISVYRLNADGSTSWVCELRLNSEDDLAEFISDAFRNCTVGRLILCSRHERVVKAIKLTAKTVVVAGMLDLRAGFFEQELYEFVGSFRRVKELIVWPSHRVSLKEKEALKKFCQRRKIALDESPFP